MHNDYLVDMKKGNFVIERRKKPKKGKQLLIEPGVIEASIDSLNIDLDRIKEIITMKVITSFNNPQAQLYFSIRAENKIRELYKNQTTNSLEQN